MNQLTIGDVSITRVEEMHGPIMPPADFFPTIPSETWRRHALQLVPDHLDEPGEWVTVAMQPYLVRSGGRTILIDTGVGNDKSRPAVDAWDHNSVDFLGALAREGVAPEDVDIVVNTHLHVDHVGWNTVLQDGVWRPTFPNATYLMPETDVGFWDPVNNDTIVGSVNENVFEDSVAPVLAAGQVRTWRDSHVIDDALTLRAAPGHTPGSSVALLESDGRHALFAGDLIHNPIQVEEHAHSSCFCVSPDLAVASRIAFFDWAVDHDALVLPAHISGHSAFTLGRSGSDYAIRTWAAFDRL